MKSQIFRLLFCIFALVCSSCKISLPSAYVPPNRSQWISTWLRQPTCEAPCWENITPGSTSIQNSLGILQHIPDLKIIDQNRSGASWIINGRDTGGLGASGGSDIVSTIDLNIDASENLTLSEIHDVYSSPSEISIFRCQDGLCEVHLTYPTDGMVIILLASDVGSTKDQVDISENSKTVRIWFFPNLDYYFRQPDQTGETFLPWKGYSTYP